jgi:hypothetical protein
MNARNMLECVPLASLSSLAEYLLVRARAYFKGELHLGAPHCILSHKN